MALSALKSSNAAGQKPRDIFAGFCLSACEPVGSRCRSSQPDRAEDLSSQEDIGKLIERVKDFDARDDERCDHQIEAKMHCGHCSKAFLRPAHCVRRAVDQTHELLEVICIGSVLSRAGVVVNNLWDYF
jgi:hypothetical protein